MNKKCILLVLILIGLAQTAWSQEQLQMTIQGLELTFIKVPKGTFWMGADSNDVFTQKDEYPARIVTISKDFYFGQTEVTQELWEQVMHYNPSTFRHPQNPVEMISWNDCQYFIDVLNNLWEGEGQFRFPSEAEWEYACRMGELDYKDEQGSIVPWKLRKYAWFNSRSEGKSHPVASKAPDQMGFYDLKGSLWEWCQDWRGKYTPGPQTDPSGPPNGTRKIYRGGSWFNEPEALRAENRHGHEPDQVFTNAGLRLVYVLE
ncbi:MAG: formylglycine-generating enzyme family protein [Bacteroidota bacterium]